MRKDYKPVTECLEKTINDNENGNAKEREKLLMRKGYCWMSKTRKLVCIYQEQQICVISSEF